MKKAGKLLLFSLALAPALALPGWAEGPRTEVAAQAEQSLAAEIRRALALDDIVAVMAEEALVTAGEGAEGLTSAQQDSWRRGIARINSPEHLHTLFQQKLGEALRDADPAPLRKALRFYQGDLGHRVVALELSARKAMVDPEGKAAAIEAAAAADKQDNPRIGAIMRLIDAADAIEVNISGSLNSMMAATRGFAAASGVEIPESQITAEAWQEEPAIRDDISEWVRALLYLSYSPVDDRELEEVIAFVASDEGRALSKLLSQAFDAMFTRTAFETGMMSASVQMGQEL